MKIVTEPKLQISNDRSKRWSATFYLGSITLFFAPAAWLTWAYTPAEVQGHWFLWSSVCVGTLACGITFAMMIQASLISFGINNDDISKKYTEKVIKSAKNWLVFYDYGEKSSENIYGSEKIKEVITDQLRDNPELNISFIFKKSKKDAQGLKLIKGLHEWREEEPGRKDRVKFVYDIDREEEKYNKFNYEGERIPYHYKINDQNYAYLTQHIASRGTRYVYSNPMGGRHFARVQGCLDFHQQVIREHKSS